MIEILNPDLSPLEGVVIPDLEAGQNSGVVPFVLRNTGGSDLEDLLLVVQAQDPGSGRWVSAGLPPLDELWARIRITGLTDWTPVGAWRGLRIPTLLDGGLRTGELLMRPPATASPLAWTWQIAVVAAEHSRGVPPGGRSGVLTGLGDRGHSALLHGLRVAASSPADDMIHVAAGHSLYRGRLVGTVATAVALDQTDSAAETLSAGESYWAVLSAGSGGVTVTKGPRAAVPMRPAPPAWEPPLAAVQVRVQGGPSVLEETDLVAMVVYDRYLAEPGAGLQLRVHAGQALGGGALRFHAAQIALSLPASSTRWLWQRASGAWELTATEEPPESTALGPLWQVVTDATDVTDLVDLRDYAADCVVISLRGDLPGAPGEIASQLVGHDGLVLETVLYRLSDNGGGTAGQTQLDLELDGVTLHTSHATDDQRPAWAWDATDLIHGGGVHEVTEMRPGQVISLVSTAHPTGGTPVSAETSLVFRRKS